MHLQQGLMVLVFTIITVTALKEKRHLSSELVRCPFPAQQVYSHKAKKCVSLVNGPCLISNSDKATGCSNLTTEEDSLGHDTSAECIPGAYCKQSGLFGYCTCNPGLVDTADRKCALTHGQPCDISSEVQCDEHTLLGCIEGKCDCVDPMHEFSAYSGLCLGKVGAYCKRLTPEQERKYVPNYEYVPCGPGAFCFASVGVDFVGHYSYIPVKKFVFVSNRFGNGVCRCDKMSGYRETENRTCEYARRIYKSYHAHEEWSGNGSEFSSMGTLCFLLNVGINMMILILCSLFGLQCC